MLEKTPTELNTEQLHLRLPQHSDAVAIQSQASNPRVALMTAQVPHPYGLSDATEWLAGLPGLRDSGESLTYALFIHTNKQLIGVISLMGIADDEAELGYWIGEEFWGQGYCSEAGRAILDVGFRDLSLRGVRAHHIARNPASGRVLEKLGFEFLSVQSRRHRGHEVPCRTYYLASPSQSEEV